MFVYLLKSAISLVLLLGFYHLILEKEKMHQFNRFFLLGSIVFSFIVPSFMITVAPTETEATIIAEQGQIITQTDIVPMGQTLVSAINYENYGYSLYLIISGILLLYFVKNIYTILSKTKKNEKVNYYSATVILLQEKILPHSFLKYIFINKNEYIDDTSEHYILTHELAHVQQKHSLDIVFIELLQIAFWFFPVFKFYKKAIQLNHEFLADEAVNKSHKNITEYQHVLLNTSAQNNNIYLASNLNYSLTKKRLLMMTKPCSKTKVLLKKLLVAPLMAGFIFAFAQRVEAQEKKQKPQVIEVKIANKNISNKEMKEYKALFNSGNKTKIYKEKDVLRMISLYKRMSKKQQNSVTDIRKVIPPPPPKKRRPQIREVTPVKIKVVKRQKKHKPQIREIEKTPVVVEIIESPKVREIEELVEVRELKEVQKRPRVVEVIEKAEAAETEQKVTENSRASSKNEISNLNNILQNNTLKKTYYINNKKVSERKIKKLRLSTIKNFRIENKKNKVYSIYLTVK